MTNGRMDGRTDNANSRVALRLKIVNVTFFCHSGTEVEATVGGEGGGYGGYGYGGYSGGYGGGYSMPNSNYSYYG